MNVANTSRVPRTILGFAFALLLPLIAAAQAIQTSRPEPSSEFKRAAQALTAEAPDNALRNPTVIAFLANKANPSTERFKLRMLQLELDLKKQPTNSRSNKISARKTMAEALIAEFPNEKGSYGYLLSVAKAMDPERAARIARRLEKSDVDESIREGARRILRQRSLVGKRLRLEELKELKGRTVILYGWTLDRPPHSGVLAAAALPSSDLAFIGVCLDADPEQALVVAEEWGLPGVQLCDGEGREGSLAKSLGLTLKANVYFIGPDGRVEDVQGHFGFAPKLAARVGSLAPEPETAIEQVKRGES